MTTVRQDVSGNYAGPVTRLLANVIDLSIAGFMFVLGMSAFDYIMESIAGVETHLPHSANLLRGVAGLVWFVVYFWVCVAVAGKTPGKAVLGLRVLTGEGAVLSGWKSGLRAAALPLSYLVFGMGFLGIVLGKERRALHDVIAGSAVVYDWGPRTAELPMPISAFIERRADAAPGEEGAQ